MKTQKSISVNDANILVVEDNLICAEVLQSTLNDLGYKHVNIITKGIEALDIPMSEVDLIFIDINLPDISGIKLCQIIRKMILPKEIPIICYSSLSDAHEKECIEAGMNDFLQKTFKLEDLIEIMESWLPARNIK